MATASSSSIDTAEQFSVKRLPVKRAFTFFFGHFGIICIYSLVISVTVAHFNCIFHKNVYRCDFVRGEPLMYNF
uniref:Uncharacterized protein n=1 Tax=Pararge aegeria TaxID=116150 RepID=S4PXC5_9NEOP